MKSILGLINLTGSDMLKEISTKRPLASQPFAGKFRLMDFSLSAMVNAGVDTVGLILPFHSRSILDHVRSAKEWNLAHKQRGLFYLPVDEEEEILNPQQSDIRTYHKNLRYVELDSRRYLLLAGCDVICNIDYEKVLHFHRRHNADITMVYKVMEEDSPGSGYRITNRDSGRITGMEKVEGGKQGEALFLGSLLIDCELFIKMVRCAYELDPLKSFNEVLARNVGSLRVFGFPYEGYAKRINSLSSYYQANMDMLHQENWREIFNRDRRIFTKIKDEAPAKYMEAAKVNNSLIANGCIIEGTVENSILFRKVRIGRNAVIRNSIIMQNTTVGEDAFLNYVVCDKDRDIQQEAILEGTKEEPLCIVKYEVL